MSKLWLSRQKTPASGPDTKWVHQPETLLNDRVIYPVKLFGCVEAAGAKGIDVVRDAMQKAKFNRHLLKSDGVKCPKVELIISVDYVGVRNVKTKAIMHDFALQQLSYCADDKAEKRLFAFIARDGPSHKCFVFDSEKAAEEITLTIGQAFELAYQKYLTEKPDAVSSPQDQSSVMEKQNAMLIERVMQLEAFICANGLQPPVPSTNQASAMRPRTISDSGGSSREESGFTDSITAPQQDSFENIIPFDSGTLHGSNGSNGTKNGNGENGKIRPTLSVGSIPALQPPPIPARSTAMPAEHTPVQVAPVLPTSARPRPQPATVTSSRLSGTYATVNAPPSVSEMNPFNGNNTKNGNSVNNNGSGDNHHSVPPFATAASPWSASSPVMSTPMSSGTGSFEDALVAAFDPLSSKV